MRDLDIRILLLSLLTSTQVLSEPRFPSPKSIPRSLEAVLIQPTSTTSSQPTSPNPTPILRHLDLRQVAAPAAAQPAAAQPAAAQPAAAQPAAAQPAAAAPAAAGAAAPAAGVGGAGAAPAAAQPQPGAQADPVTTIQVQTVIGGVTTQVPQLYTQTFAAGASAPPVLTGTIGLGTLTGKIGVVKTQDAKKSDAVAMRREVPVAEMMVVLVAGIMALSGGVLGIVRL